MKYNENTLVGQNGEALIKSFFSTVRAGRREYREHHHAECELSTFLSGSGTYSVKNREYEFKSGDVFLFSGDESHCITNINSEFELLNLHFQPRVLWNDPDDFTAMKILFARGKAFENRIERTNPSTRVIRDNIIRLEDELREKRSGYRAVAKHLLCDSLIALVRDFGYTDDNVEYESVSNAVPLMEEALVFINENLDKPLTLDEIAERAALSPSYFSSIFKKMNGISLWEYITIKRVEKAIGLLKTTNDTKLNIAMQCGFNSSSNFYKAFFRITGKKPGSYQSGISQSAETEQRRR